MKRMGLLRTLSFAYPTRAPSICPSIPTKVGVRSLLKGFSIFSPSWCVENGEERNGREREGYLLRCVDRMYKEERVNSF